MGLGGPGVDRALRGDPIGDPVVGQAYYRLITVARERRGELDEQFGARLAAWTRTAMPAAPGGALLIEDVLAKLAVPVAAQAPPLVLVLDGMSAAVAAQLSDEIDRRVWTEIVPKPEGVLRRGGRPQCPCSLSHHRQPERLAHRGVHPGWTSSGNRWIHSLLAAAPAHRPALPQGQIGGVEGHRLAPELLAALAGEDVVGVVLNTIDDALDHGQEGERTSWRLRDISHLLDLLNAARGYGRPVILVSDHGHVLDRSPQGQGR